MLLRLPLEVKDLFHEWVREHFPDRADKVIHIVRETQGGKDYNSTWFKRGRGTGPYAWLIGRRFQMTCERLGLNERRLSLDVSQFRRPEQNDGQLKLFAYPHLPLPRARGSSLPHPSTPSPRANKPSTMPRAAKKPAPKNAARKNGKAEKTPRLPLNEPIILRPTFRRERRWLVRHLAGGRL